VGRICQALLIHARVVHRCMALPVNEVSPVAPGQATISPDPGPISLPWGNVTHFGSACYRPRLRLGRNCVGSTSHISAPAPDGAGPPLSTLPSPTPARPSGVYEWNVVHYLSNRLAIALLCEMEQPGLPIGMKCTSSIHINSFPIWSYPDDHVSHGLMMRDRTT
jgi:hypothetical protein